ncbi:uncharacterized protein Gasu_01400 [Galdieria sulphuraria]|uniref:Uncharacterized protein n=1 Tax=Galdieria sulphuraria TaxID=130081 RepID=M2Y9M4_GALSU|nr:uncharacterized protein Gasu_01400 [Galdieria sulphuraria]EME32778.1 hypothetical protein Gasu_01400 [Galdieria sulphuraria]|eukprot:XP_005709298.1 hypothetical protein Gasu_01400 [Galdieria sulphuraria]
MEGFLFVSYSVIHSRRKVGHGSLMRHLSEPSQHLPTRLLRLKQHNCTTKHMRMNKSRSWQDVPPFRDAPERVLQRSFDSFLQELASIQEPTPKCLGIIGTRNCSLGHQQLIELISYASILVGNHLYTSGGGGTNAAAIRGALRANKPEQLTVILPQSQVKQPEEILALLKTVRNVHEMPHNDDLPLDVASRLCNSVIISKCQQIISFAFHDSHVVLEAVNETKALKKLVTLFYLD